MLLSGYVKYMEADLRYGDVVWSWLATVPVSSWNSGATHSYLHHLFFHRTGESVPSYSSSAAYLSPLFLLVCKSYRVYISGFSMYLKWCTILIMLQNSSKRYGAVRFTPCKYPVRAANVLFVPIFWVLPGSAYKCSVLLTKLNLLQPWSVGLCILKSFSFPFLSPLLA